MSDPKPVDQLQRDRFEKEWDKNFAVCANAGSGKTTAISGRLATLALHVAAQASTSSSSAQLLSRTAVVTYTKKAARQIGQRARSKLGERLAKDGKIDLNTLELLDRAFFGTIHAFCLNLARRHGHTLGAHLNPEVIDDDDAATWQVFLESDPLTFPGIPETVIEAFLRHRAFDSLFPLAQSLSTAQGEALLARLPASLRPAPNPGALAEIHAIKARSNSAQKVAQNQATAQKWVDSLASGSGFIGFPVPDGTAGGVKELFEALVAPVKQWVADVGGALASVLAARYRTFRREKGVQTYSDQTEMALAVLKNSVVLNRIREEGWRIILDEAQDTDPAQFSILVEITRPVDAVPGDWPSRNPAAPGPRPGHFSMVGDGQQAIYGSRADVSNFLRYVQAFREGRGGEVLGFAVTFRSPQRLITFMNAGMPDAFDGGRAHNYGPSGTKGPRLQVDYQALAARPNVVDGGVFRLPLRRLNQEKIKVDEAMREEAAQVAEALARYGPSGFGVRNWGELCLIAPRNDWIKVVAEVFQARGQKVALQVRKTSNAANPVHAWITGLFAVLCLPEDVFEWTGVLREIFGISDATLARAFQGLEKVQWDEGSVYGGEIGAALERLQPFIQNADDEGLVLGKYLQDLVTACDLRARAASIDPSGGLATELDRLLQDAAQRGFDGETPRLWFEHLLQERLKGRPSGNPEPDAINLITAHSAKGLEWPVVIPLGLWRPLGMARENGFRVVEERGSGIRVFYDGSSVPDDMEERHRAETWRENTRLLYVALTRPDQLLVLPWVENFGPPLKANEMSFASLWGNTDLWNSLPEFVPLGAANEVHAAAPAKTVETVTATDRPEVREVPLPLRLLPHQLAQHSTDQTRLAFETRDSGAPAVRGDPDEAVNYGLWWHETLEFFPWSGNEETVADYVKDSLQKAEVQGWGARSSEELARWLRSPARVTLSSPKWKRQAELNVFSPVADGAWIDGVMDLVLLDDEAREVHVVDWKTNRRRLAEDDVALAARVVEEYTPQLQAYGRALAGLYPEFGVRLWLYPTALGDLVAVPFSKPGASPKE